MSLGPWFPKPSISDQVDNRAPTHVLEVSATLCIELSPMMIKLEWEMTTRWNHNPNETKMDLVLHQMPKPLAA